MPKQLTNLTNLADQRTTFTLSDGSSISFEFIFNGTTERWTFNMSYKTTTVNGMGLCCHPNILRQWKNILPFGMACITKDQTDPVSVNDFATSRVALYILDSSDVLQVESSIFGGPQI